MKKPAHVVLVAILLYAGLAGGGIFGLIRPKLDERSGLLTQKQTHEATIAKRPEYQSSLERYRYSQMFSDAQLEAYRAVRMPAISYTGGELYALQGFLFEQREDLGPIILNTIALSGNLPGQLQIPAPELKAPTPIEPLPIPGEPIEVSFVGTFSSMLNFLERLPDAPRLFAVGSRFRMEEAGGNELSVTLPLQEFTFARGTEGKFSTPAAAPQAAGAGAMGPGAGGGMGMGGAPGGAPGGGAGAGAGKAGPAG